MSGAIEKALADLRGVALTSADRVRRLERRLFPKSRPARDLDEILDAMRQNIARQYDRLELMRLDLHLDATERVHREEWKP